MSLRHIKLDSQADAVFHVDHMAAFRETIDQGGGHLGVFQKRAPLTKAQFGGNQGGFALVPLVHQGEEKPHLYRFHLYVPELIDEQAVIGDK